jgi:hypothetical protein
MTIQVQDGWAWPIPPLDFPAYDSEGFLLDEDRALRDLMKGMVVTDHENRQRNVEAWFGHPDKELREQKYPYVTVDMLQIEEAPDRAQRGRLWIADPPKWWGLAPLKAWQVGYMLEMPTPVNLDYQISTWSRNPRHDRQILFQLITGGRTMLRNGLLYTADNKIRRMDYLGHVKRDITDENGKRLFNNIFRVRISSEVPWGIIRSQEGVGLVTDIRISMKSFLSTYGKVLDETSITWGVVSTVHAESRTVDLQVAEGRYYGARVSTLVPVPVVGDVVAVSREELTSTPSDITDYRLVVIGIEYDPPAEIGALALTHDDPADGGT